LQQASALLIHPKVPEGSFDRPVVAAASVDAPADQLDVARDVTIPMIDAIHAWAVRVALLVTEIAQEHWFASESAPPFLFNPEVR
jgi:hypothetical protein